MVGGFHMAMGRVPAEERALPATGGDRRTEHTDEERATADSLRAQAFEILHGDRLVLVDAKGHLRGYYVADDEGLHRILRDARSLAGRG